LQLSVVCSPALLANDHPLSSSDDLASHVLLHDGHGKWPLFFEQVGSTVDLSAIKALKFSHESLAIDAAVSGQGVALASEPLVEADILAGRLSRPLDLILIDELGYYVVTPRSPRKSGQVNRMREWLLSQRKLDAV
jgi:LysR family transcriptional regulator, glycine cleavage system transcriptional activator